MTLAQFQPTDDRTRDVARRLAGLIEPVVGSVYFAPECHAEYARLGFGSSVALAGKVALPDGPAYFTSRGSCMGQVAGQVVAAAFGVFNPAAVVPSVDYGWSLTDATTIATARTRGATAQLVRILGEKPARIDRAIELFTRMTDTLPVDGRHLYAGLRSLPVPDDAVGRMWRLGDYLREYRGDSHNCAWVTAGLNAVDIGLLTELYIRLPLKSYIRTRAWDETALDASIERLAAAGLLNQQRDGFSPEGRAFRESIELATDASMRTAIAALGDDADELFGILAPWGAAVRDQAGYLSGGADDLARPATERR